MLFQIKNRLSDETADAEKRKGGTRGYGNERNYAEYFSFYANIICERYRRVKYCINICF